MPIRYNIVRGRPSLAFIRPLGTSINAPNTVTATLTAGAAAGAKTLSVSSLSGPIPANTLLRFDRAAGNPDEVAVIVTEDALGSATALTVETFDGAEGDGISHALSTSDFAIWDGLWTDGASQNLDFQANEQTQELTAVTHGSATGVKVSIPEVTSVQPQFTRQGLFLNNSPLLDALVKNVKTPNQNWWGKYIVAGADGQPSVTYAGLGRVFGVSHPTPADNITQLSYTFRFVSDAYTITSASDAPGS